MREFEAVIIEDDKDHMAILQMYLAKSCKDIKVVAFGSTVEDAINVIQEKQPEIIFLDLDLQGESSFEILDNLPFLKNVEIIITSSHREYALEAFRHWVTDYVLKPLNPDQLLLAVEKAKENIALKERADNVDENPSSDYPLTRLAIPSVDSVKIISVDEVMYLKSDGRYTIFYLKDNTTHTASKNLGEYEKLLNNSHFLRIHHSLLVNMNYAVDIQKKDGYYLTMPSQKHLPISKRKINMLYRYLNLK